MSCSFPFFSFLPSNELPFYFEMVETFFRENVLILSENCISVKVEFKDLLKELNKKFPTLKLKREQFFLAFEYFKNKKNPFFSEISFQETDDCFYGFELLRYKPFKFVTQKSEKCKKCGLYQDLNKDGHCVYCRVDTTLRKTRKEHQVRDFLLENGWKLYSADKVIDHGECNKHRPDVIIDLGVCFLVVEIDEHQHQSYVPECETARIVNVYHALGCAKLILVRFNPDKFIDKYYCKNKMDLKLRCEWLDRLLREIQKDIVKIDSLPTILQYCMFFDYDPSKTYTTKECVVSVETLVEHEILEFVVKHHHHSPENK